MWLLSLWRLLDSGKAMLAEEWHMPFLSCYWS